MSKIIPIKNVEEDGRKTGIYFVFASLQCEFVYSIAFGSFCDTLSTFYRLMVFIV